MTARSRRERASATRMRVFPAASAGVRGPVLARFLPGPARSLLLRLALTLLACAAAASAAAPFAPGASEAVLDVEGAPLQVYTYKPAAYGGGELLLVLHGLGRNAEGYRDYARPLADRYGYLVVAPLFDRERFPTWRYQQGGLARRLEGTLQVQRREDWIGTVLEGVVDAVRQVERAPSLPYSLVGHSAGAQALSRYAAFTSNRARRIVIANPSTWLWPALEARYPYGYADLPAALVDEAALRRYLAQPVVVLLGTADVEQGKDLNLRPGAMAQGANRYERGVHFYRAGERLARERGWPFGWRLVEVADVGHSARRMFASEAAAHALGE